MLKEIIISMRPKQWYKNVFLFAGIIFSSNLFNIGLLTNSISAFIIFCILSGSVYIVNDIIDIEKDKHHPIKFKRPISSGKIKKSHAIFFVSILIVIALFWSYLINIKFLLSSIVYILLITSYSLWLKHFIIVEFLIISVGFVIRSVAGCLAIGVFISQWLIICTFLLATVLALGKRKHELVLLGDDAKNHRKALGEYSIKILDQMIDITMSSLIMSYSLYTFYVSYYMMVTIPFMIYGLFRYLILVNIGNFGAETEMLFKDKGMLSCMIIWGFLIIFILYELRGI